jgi:HD-like signal output (HDOD) protein
VGNGAGSTADRTLGDRWTHVQAVADKARGVATVLPVEDADLLVAAALVHDVGYAPSLDRLGFGSGAGQELHPQEGHRAVPHRD